MPVCQMHNCINEQTHPKLGLCNSCYGIMLRWKKRTLKDKKLRALRLQRLQECMDTVLATYSTEYRPYVAKTPAIKTLPGEFAPVKKYKKKTRRAA